MSTMVRASGLRGYVPLMHTLAVDPSDLLRRYGISLAQLEDDDALLPLREVVQLLEASAAATACDDFGLQLSRRQDIAVLGPLALAVQSADTVRNAFELAVRYLFVHSPGLVLALHERSSLIADATEISLEIELDQPTAQRQTIDLCLADMHRFLRLVTGDAYAPLALALPHAPLAPAAVYQRFFGCQVLFEQPRGGIHIRPSLLDASLGTMNRALQQIAEGYLLSHYGAPGGTLKTRTRRALLGMLGTPQGNKEGVCRLLAIHPRTLQRRLEQEGTSFEAIRDGVRREEMLRYLCETTLPLGQVAEILGYSEQSSMSRACSRWFGSTPAALRRAPPDRGND